VDSLLYVEDLTVSFDGFLALRKLNMIVESQERIRLLIGPNGAGKTTFFDVLTGGVRPTEGRVLFGERTSLPELSTHAIAALGVCRKFQTPSVFPGHTVRENMILAAGRKGFTATLAAGTSGGDREAIATVLEQVGLAEEAGRLAGTLAHGQKQWLEIAMLLLESPTLLLLDEPVAGMTRPEKEKTGALLENIVEQSSCTVMLIEHDMEFVRQVARRGHRVTVLHEGSVLSEGPLDQVQADERVIEAYLGRGRVRRALTGVSGAEKGR
jgi:urea transport system ATP-binding protein